MDILTQCKHRGLWFVFAVLLSGLLIGATLLLTGDQTARADPGVIYVDAAATGAETGASWADAYTSVQDGLFNAYPGGEIWVASGVYYPDEGSGQTDGDPASTFTLQPGVALYGGFAGTEATRDERDWSVNITVLSGDIDGNDGTDASGVVTDTTNITGANAYHVVTGGGVTETAVLNGFVITAGSGDGADWPEYCGGGMYSQDSSPTLANVRFSGNYAREYGAGLYTWNSPLVLTNATFSGNQTLERGGGMYNVSSSPTLTNVIFTDNQANLEGGGMYNSESAPTLTNVTFSGNQSGGGGGMYNGKSSHPTLNNVTFSGNWATDDGGGMHNYKSSPTLTNVTFSGNRAFDLGGGMFNLDGSSPTVVNAIVWGNKTDSWGSLGDEIHNYDTSSVPTVTYSDVRGGYSGDGNINSDPLFAAPVAASEAPTTTGDYHVPLDSPCVDVGTPVGAPATDFEGDPRPWGFGVDMGADESVLHIVDCYDFLDPEAVGAEDVQYIAAHWRESAEAPFDTDGDGVITVIDIMRVVADWGEVCS